MAQKCCGRGCAGKQQALYFTSLVVYFETNSIHKHTLYGTLMHEPAPAAGAV